MSTLTTAGITFGDSSVQNTAATALTTANVMNAIAGQTTYGIGSITSARCSLGSRVNNNDTVSGSYLFNVTSDTNGTRVHYGLISAYDFVITGSRVNATTAFTFNPGAGNLTMSPIGFGTWRNIASMNGPCQIYCGGTYMPFSLWLRIS